MSVRSYKSYNRNNAILHRQPSIRLAAAPGEDRGRAAMALAALSGEEQSIIFSQLCNAHAGHSVPGRHSRRRRRGIHPSGSSLSFPQVILKQKTTYRKQCAYSLYFNLMVLEKD